MKLFVTEWTKDKEQQLMKKLCKKRSINQVLLATTKYVNLQDRIFILLQI